MPTSTIAAKDRFWLLGPDSFDNGPISKHPSLKAAQKAGDAERAGGAGALDVVDIETGETWALPHDNRDDDQEWEKDDGKLSKEELNELINPAPIKAPKVAIPDFLVAKGKDIANVLGHFDAESVAKTEFFALSGRFPVPVLELTFQGLFGTKNEEYWLEDSKGRTRRNTKLEIEARIARTDGEYFIFEREDLEDAMKQRSEEKARKLLPLMLAKAEKMTASKFLEHRRFDIKVNNPANDLTLEFEGRSFEEFKALLKRGFKAIEFPKKLVMDVKDVIAAGGDLSKVLAGKCKIKA